MKNTARRAKGGAWEVFLVFLRLGLTSFGGPIAHLGYFRTEFVERRRWLDDHAFSDLVALCQFLPGPASSQVGMAVGLGRAGWPGLAAAWLGFTLPSAAALVIFGLGVGTLPGFAESGAMHGLKIVAVAVVAQAVWGMAAKLTPDRPRAAMAVLAALLTTLLPAAVGQVGAIVVSGLLGWRFLRPGPDVRVEARSYPVPRSLGLAALAAFALPLVALPLWAAAAGSSVVALLGGVYRAGALVFGGGHVVLPLLQAVVVPTGAMTDAAFLAGYGAAQAVPGPLFSFGAYLGAVADWPLRGWVGGAVLLVVIFLPALLVLTAALPFWETLRQRPGVRTAMAGINAGVVGILLAALYDPVFTSAVHARADFALALAAFGLLMFGRVPPVVVVLASLAAGWALGL